MEETSAWLEVPPAPMPAPAATRRRINHSVWRRTIGKREPSGFSSVPCGDDCGMEMAHGQGMVLKIGGIGLLPKPTTSIRQKTWQSFRSSTSRRNDAEFMWD